MPDSRAKAIITVLLYSLLRVSSLSAAEEKVMALGTASGWGAAEKRVQVSELSAIRPYPVLALSSAWTGVSAANGAEPEAGGNGGLLALYAAYRNFPVNESALDMALSFDEESPGRYRDAEGRYRVETAAGVQAVSERWARYGAGAALFSGSRGSSEESPVVIKPLERDALFSPGRSMRDFTLEFWLYPNNLENGEQPLAWSAVPFSGASSQKIYCEAAKNRLRWTFQNFFAAPNAGVSGNGGGGTPFLSIVLESRAALVPRNWSHHLIRYSAATGLIEYLINGNIENIAYATASGREGGEVYTPWTGRNGAFTLGARFSGLLDEFRVYNRALDIPGRTALDAAGRTSLGLPELAKFPKSGGRAETRVLDLGEPGSAVLRVESSGGRYRAGQAGRADAKNVYVGKSGLRFGDDSEVQLFIRAGEEPYRFENLPWTPVTPGAALSGRVQGRYIQLAAVFYPSGDCETTPYLEELRVIYEQNEAPWPPTLVTARALDGAVELDWRASPDPDAAGYLVYYGTSGGVYYGEGAGLGESPIDAGRRTSLRIEGLQNGVLYYFTIAAYDRTSPYHAGKFSKEVTARPLRKN